MKNLYSIYDQKTRIFDAPFLSETDQAAQRMFERISNNVPVIKDNPSDFDLYYVGTFDGEDGQLKPTNTVQKIINGLSFTEIPSKENPYDATTKISDVAPILPGAEGGNPTL